MFTNDLMADRNTEDQAALERVIQDLEGYLDGIPDDEPGVVQLREDVAACRRIVSWMGNTVTLGSSDG